MAKFHINTNGDVKPCNAEKRACQFGDSSLHFASAEEGRAFVEKILETSHGIMTPLTGSKMNRTWVEMKARSAKDAPLRKRVSKATGSKPRPISGPARVDSFMKSRGMTLVQRPEPHVRDFYEKRVPEGIEVRIYEDANGNVNGAYFDPKEKKTKTWKVNLSPLEIPMEVEEGRSWNKSLHPQGPKVKWICPRCDAYTEQRAATLSPRERGEYRSTCGACQQTVSMFPNFD